jgi:SPP1 family predicted phage head-tail adaptor
VIGELRHLLTLESETRTDDGCGGFSSAWNAVASLWGEIRAVVAEEETAADRTLASVTHRIAIRHRAGVLPAQRFSHAGRIFRIEGVRDPDGRKRLLICDCREEIAG